MSMGVNLSGQGPDRYQVMSEINVTPMVDIMLVLLIIFMVTAPLLTQGVEVNLPSDNAESLTANREPLVVTVSPEGTPYIEEQAVSLDELTHKIATIRKNSPELPVYVRGDRKAAYGAVMKVMVHLQQAGVTQLGLVTEPAP